MILFVLVVPLFSAGTQEEAEAIIIAAPRSAAALPALWLQDNEPFPDFPEIRVELYSSMEAMMALAQSDDVDFMLMPSNSAATLYNKGFEVKMLNVFQWGALFLSTTDPECKEWEDLAGKELYVPAKGSVPDMTTQLFLKKHGLKIGKDLTVVYSNHSEITQLLNQGTISYAVDVQPFVTANKDSVKNYRIISEYSVDWEQLAGEGFKMPGFCMVAKKKGIEKDIEYLELINRGFSVAVKETTDNTEESGVRANTYMNADAELIAKSLSGFRFSFFPVETIVSDVNRYYELLEGMKPAVIGGKLPDNGFFHIHENN